MTQALIFNLPANGEAFGRKVEGFSGGKLSDVRPRLSEQDVINAYQRNNGFPDRSTFASGTVDVVPSEPIIADITLNTQPVMVPNPAHDPAADPADPAYEPPTIPDPGGATFDTPTASNIRTDPDAEDPLPAPMPGAQYWSLLGFGKQAAIRMAGEAGDETIQTFREYMNMAGAKIDVTSTRTIAAVRYLSGEVPGVNSFSISSALLTPDEATAWLKGERVPDIV